MVAPFLRCARGLPAVTPFVKITMFRSGRFKLRMVSLSTTSAHLDIIRCASPSACDAAVFEAALNGKTPSNVPFLDGISQG